MTTDLKMLQDVRWIDLTVPLSHAHPRHPRQMSFHHVVSHWYAPTGVPTDAVDVGPAYQAWLVLDEHAGTHCDAPSHWVPPAELELERASQVGGIGVDAIELSQLNGPACVVDVRNSVGRAGLGSSPIIEVDVVERWEREHRSLEPGDVVVFRGDWDRHYRAGEAGRPWVQDVVDGRAEGWPAPSPEAIEYMFDRGVRLLGTDAVSIGAAHDLDTAHFAALSRGMVVVEALTNLALLPPTGAHFIFLPIKLVGGSGGLGRAVALVADEVEQRG